MKKFQRKFQRKIGGLAAVLFLSACTSAQLPALPSLDVPDAYRGAASVAPLDGAWQVAVPSDASARGAWWLVFNDAILNQLMADAASASPTLERALARVAQARADAGLVEAERGVQMQAQAGPQRSASAAAAPQTAWQAGFNLSYEVDLFGRLTQASEAAALDVGAQQAAYQSVLLTLQADVAQTYFAIRALDAELTLLHNSVRLRQEAVDLLQQRYAAGDIGELDLAQAQTELAVSQSEQQSVLRVRSLRDHALALLLGQPPARFTLTAATWQVAPLSVPPGLPSALLERRPDIAQAQRAMRAANMRIGVAATAFFPRLSLTGSAGYQSTALSDLFTWSSRSWLLGPLSGAMLSLPLLDGGRNKANLVRADAAYQGLVADYRQQVLIGFREVEDSLSTLRLLDHELVFNQDAVDAAERAAHVAQARYEQGLTSYLQVIDAQRSRLRVQRALNRNTGQRAMAAVGLIRALGGAWQS